MTRIKVVVDRDADGRLHGTIERDRPGATAERFTGVIEMVAQIEASLDPPQDAGGLAPDHCSSGPPTSQDPS